MTAKESLQDNPGLEQKVRGTRPDIKTIQTKLPPNATPEQKEFYEHYCEAVDKIGKMSFGKNEDGSDIYMPVCWAVPGLLVGLVDGIESGKTSVEEVLSWRNKPKAKADTKPKASEKAKADAKPKAKAPKKPKAKGKAKSKKKSKK